MMNDETFFESESESELRRRGSIPRAPWRFPAPKLPPPRRFPLPPRRRPVRRTPVGFGFPVPAELPAPSDFIRSVQSDLAEALGMVIPITGVLSAATRRALRIFQSRMGLPVTGDVSGSTLRALRRALSTRRSSPVFDDSAPPAGSAWLPEPEPSPTAPPDSADEPGPEEGSGGEEEPQEEFRITRGGTISITRHKTVSVADVAAKRATLPNDVGIYVIHDRTGPWYVGISDDGIANRFRSRFAALKDFNLSDKVPADLLITPYVLKNWSGVGVTWIGKPPKKPRPSHAGANSALETHFIRALGTAGRGNVQPVKATIAAGQTASMRIEAASGAGPEPAWQAASRLSRQLSLGVI